MAEQSTAKKKTSRVPFIIGMVLGITLASGGAYGAYVWYGPAHFERQAQVALDKAVFDAIDCVLPEDEAAQERGSVIERTVRIPSLIVNPADSGGRHFLVSPSIVLDHVDDVEAVEAVAERVNDRAIRMLRSWTMRELRDPDAPATVAAEMKRIVEDAANVGVEEINFRAFVLQ